MKGALSALASAAKGYLGNEPLSIIAMEATRGFFQGSILRGGKTDLARMIARRRYDKFAGITAGQYKKAFERAEAILDQAETLRKIYQPKDTSSCTQ